jgi:transforming growth factor-beta-induced protein
MMHLMRCLPDWPELIEALLNDIPTLTAILTYHVAGVNALSTDLTDGQEVVTLNGESVTVTINADGVFINDAQVTVADLVAENGVVHVIDAVLLPPAESNTVVDIIVNSPDHEILETAVVAAGLAGALSGEGPFTVFAPTDAAFNALPAGTIEALLNDIPTLTSILTYHVAGVNALSTDLTDGQEVVTLNGESVTVTISVDGVFINDAQVTVADLVADNGVVHVINAVLLPPAESNTVVDIIVNSPDHEILETAVIAADLAGALSGEGPFTVFAPTDAAFNALPAGTIEALLNDIPTLTSILTYHVAGGNVLSTDLTNGQEVVTLNGELVTVTINADGVFINDAQVTVADLVADNGVVHVIDAVLLPPARTTVVDIIVNSPDHTILETAVVAADLAGALSGEGPFTVFAPTDAAFNALPAGTIEALLNDIPTLTSILTYHVAGGNVLSTDLTNGQEVVTLNGKSVTVTINADGVFINDAQVTVADLVADNGVVHVIDAVLLPPARTTVVDVIVNSPDHTILETAVVAAGLAGALSGEGPFTVFAPTDAAFNALPAGTIEALLNDIPTLTSILTYHVAGANVLSTDLYDGREILTLNGQVVQVRITPDGVFINNAQVTVADITTDNGVVHVIDAILLPSTGTSVFDIIAGSDVHNTLETAIRTAELVTALSNQDDIFTVFAPTDAAFAALPAGVLDTVLANKTLLRDILAYHAVQTKNLKPHFWRILLMEDIFQMLNNKTVTINVTDDGIFINDIKITVVDLFADNGIVHVIDAVLLAPDSTIIDVVRNSPVHTILENLLDEAEFSDPLEGYGPFTLFAPTNAAIQALPAEVIQALSEDIGLLEDVLAYHLVQGTALSTDLSNGLTVPTLLGKNVTVTINNDGVFINDAKVILADIRTDNGVVHVLDAVLLPKTTVVDILGERDELSTARLLVNLSGLEAALNGEGPFTVFAPDDNAFDTAPLSLLEYATSSQANLQNVLLFHTVPGRALSTDLSNGQSLTTANGKALLVTINNNGVFINNAQVIEADLVAENGVVHIIDEVLDILTSLDDIIEDKVSIYPNPTADFLRINHTYSSDAVYFITDMQNKIVRQGKVQETEQIDVRDIQSGQYQLLIQDGRKVSSGKFVKVF